MTTRALKRLLAPEAGIRVDPFVADVLPKEVRRSWRHPLDSVDTADLNRLVLQGQAHGYTVLRTDNGKRTSVLCVLPNHEPRKKV